MLKALFFTLITVSVGYSQINQDYFEVVIYRAPFPFGGGSLSPLKIKNGNEQILNIYQKKQHSVFLPVGEVFLNSTILRKGSLSFVGEKNKIYFVSVKIAGIFLDKPNFKITSISERIN